ncbi:MAG: insulinase family protein [Saprospirales bacterium]|nr:MAG: insulinase family protein [Saprospirales bacterium]
MIEFVKHTLSNGLRVLVHRDSLTPLVVTNLIYNAGSKYDPPEMTGMAHLVEHLMFGGSINAGNFDYPQQMAGGENNAFTNADITNYYQIMPKENLEVALWLESERLGFLDINRRTFDIQKEVVLEEFNETCLNEPYGDVWHYLHNLCYKKHSYRWPTIGMTPDHIRKIDIDAVEKFYRRYYQTENAILVIAGNAQPGKCLELAEKWFADIPAGGSALPELPKEPKQTSGRKKDIYALVPHAAIYMAFKIPGRLDPRFPAVDLLSDLLGLGRSSRLNEHLVEERELFSCIDAYVNGTNEYGLFIIEGKLNEGVSAQTGEEAIWESLEQVKNTPITPSELDKLINSYITTNAFAGTNCLHKAMNLAFYENLLDANLINTEPLAYKAVNGNDITRNAQLIFQEENSSVVRYFPEKI